MAYSCSDFTGDVLQWIDSNIQHEGIEDDDPAQNSHVAIDTLNGLFNAGGTLASIVDSFLNGQGAVTVEEMDAALTAWHALIKSPGKTRREKTDATSIQNRLAFTLAKVSIRLRQPVMEDDRRELRKLIEEAIAMERESRK